MAFSGKSDSGSMLSEINVTPLVDVMLVLLIIFMVAAPLMQKGVALNLPKTNAPDMPADEDKVTLSIDAERRLYLGQTFVPFSRLGDILLHNEKLQSEKELLLRADRTLPYGVVVRIMALAKLAGIDRVGMITDAARSDEVGAETTAGSKGPMAPATLTEERRAR